MRSSQKSPGAIYHRCTRLIAAVFASFLLFSATCPTPVRAEETWEKLDRRLKGQVLEVNVGIKLRMKDSVYCQIADASPKIHEYVFSAHNRDPGFRVVAVATAFPIRTKRNDKAYFLTARHIVDNADKVVASFQKFYAGMRLCAEQTATNRDVDERMRELLQIVNLSTKKNEWSQAEKVTYETTVDNIWDTYDTYLGTRADPSRTRFDKYVKLAGVTAEIGYFLHANGPVTQPPIIGHMFKCARPDTHFDIAILTADKSNIVPLDLDPIEASEGQDVQVIGYPIASDQIDTESSDYFTPTFSNGRVTKVTPHLVQVDCSITKGNSGGPVLGLRGKVLGLIVRRALTDSGAELNKFAAAMSVQQIKEFAPELF